MESDPDSQFVTFKDVDAPLSEIYHAFRRWAKRKFGMNDKQISNFWRGYKIKHHLQPEKELDPLFHALGEEGYGSDDYLDAEFKRRIAEDED